MSSGFTPNPNSGFVFRNKSGNPKAPLMKGSFADDRGRVWEIAFWYATNQDGTEKRDKNGDRYFYMKVSVPYSKDDGQGDKAPPTDDDDLPF